MHGQGNGYLREIFSEKIRALNTRKRARDLYDIYFLIKKNVKLDLLLVSEKMRLYKKMYDRNEAVERIKTLKVQWEKEIPALDLNPPQFSTVSSEVVEFLLSQ
ncbi:MAG: nucleotidyl transferase AbiEii/AbiGii toxin family protein [Thermoplasmataceae archaeon]